MDAQYWDWLIGYTTQWRARLAASCLFIFSASLRFRDELIRYFKYGTFRDLNSVSEVSMREQDQRRLQARKECPRTDSIHINYKRVCKITIHGILFT